MNITKDVFDNINRKKTIVTEKTKTKKNVAVTLISLNGNKQNDYFLSVASNQIIISELI